MDILIIFGIFIVLILSVFVRTIVLNPVSSVKYCFTDLRDFLRFRKWNNCKTGSILCFVGLFGKGKTLSAVHYVINKYRRYDGKKVFDLARHEWVTQKIHIISNVELSDVPYEKFISLSQIVTVAEKMHEKDLAEHTLTCTFVLGDEFSVQLNSRSFKTNIDPLFLNTLLTCRHHHISLVYTSQRFNHVDALLRQVTSKVIDCNKVWRVMIHGEYDAFELENASDVTAVKSRRRFGWFIHNRDYEAYDTLACVGNLIKSCKEGDMLTEDEILALQSNTPPTEDGVINPSRKYRRSRKKMRG